MNFREIFQKKWAKIVGLAALLIYLLGVVYLLLPGPNLPDLEPAFRSTEPGDTWQIPGVWAFYTDLSRRESIDFFEKAFSRSSFLNLPLPTFRLNHPPEYARETIRDTLASNFYEELIHPLRESLFISGWIPSEDQVYLSQSKEAITYFLIEGKQYNAKITLYHVKSPIWATLLIWTGIIVSSLVLAWLVIKIIRSPWLKRK
ncbi:hypothetical protein KKI19_02555 [Patescibacteria group bacterium]|nr:hypothetical protein [Patescibacteria group bacterium]